MFSLYWESSPIQNSQSGEITAVKDKHHIQWKTQFLNTDNTKPKLPHFHGQPDKHEGTFPPLCIEAALTCQSVTNVSLQVSTTMRTHNTNFIKHHSCEHL